MAQRPILERKNVFGARLIERRAAQLVIEPQSLSPPKNLVRRISGDRVHCGTDRNIRLPNGLGHCGCGHGAVICRVTTASRPPEVRERPAGSLLLTLPSP